MPNTEMNLERMQLMVKLAEMFSQYSPDVCVLDNQLSADLPGCNIEIEIVADTVEVTIDDDFAFCSPLSSGFADIKKSVEEAFED